VIVKNKKLYLTVNPNANVGGIRIENIGWAGRKEREERSLAKADDKTSSHPV